MLGPRYNISLIHHPLLTLSHCPSLIPSSSLPYSPLFPSSNPLHPKQGPFPESILMRMLVRKLPGLDASSYCWTPGMDDWRPVGQMSNFKAVLEAEGAAWYYLDKDGEQQGPSEVKQIATLLQDGEIDGLSLVWHQDLAGGWKPLSEVEELRQVLRLLMRPEEQGEDGEGMEQEEGAQGNGEGSGSGGAASMDERQVFDADEMPSLPPAAAAAASAAASAAAKRSRSALSVKQSYVADDGTKYRLNPQTNEWEEAGSGEESGEEGEEEGEGEEEEEEGNGSAARQASAAAASGGEAGNALKKKTKKKKKKKNRGGEGWDRASNKWVYVTGLPSDATVEELEAHFKQVGILAVDPETQQPRVKIYRDPTGAPKGDASVAYVRPESVELAVEILNGGLLRPGWPMTITKAVFQQKAGGNNGGEGGGGGQVKRRKVNEAKVKVARAAAKQALSWSEADDTGLGGKALRIVVVKNMFHPTECQAPGFVEELQEDLEGECSALGPLEKMTIFERHPEGVVVIKFGTAFAAEQCVKLMNGRFFAGRKLQSSYWDGSTDYTKAVFRAERPPTTTGAEGEGGGGQEGGEEGTGEAGATALSTMEDEEAAEEERRLAEFGDELDNQELPPEFQLEVAPE